jgi:predicted transcriptional regulator
MVVRPKKDNKRESYSVRLNPDLIRKLKHIAVDEKKTVSQLIEEGIMDQINKYLKKNK